MGQCEEGAYVPKLELLWRAERAAPGLLPERGHSGNLLKKPHTKWTGTGSWQESSLLKKSHQWLDVNFTHYFSIPLKTFSTPKH